MVRLDEKTFGLVLYPCKLGQRKSGVDLVPDILVPQVSSHIPNSESNVKTYDSPLIRQWNMKHGGADKESLVFQANLELRRLVDQSLKENDKTLNIGGDHSMGFGTVSAFLQAFPNDSCVIWIDAHADMNTRASSPSGNHHGMPLSFILGFDTDPAFPVPVKLSHENLTYVGIRDLDPFEIETIEKYHINVIKPEDLDGSDSNKMREFVQKYVGTGKNVHISWDVDSTEPTTDICATGTPVQGGIHCSHVKELIKVVAETNRLVSMDVTELNLELANNDEERQRSMEMTLDVIKTFIQS